MRRILFLAFLIGLIASCTSTGKEKETKSTDLVITVDELLANPEKYIENKVTVTGLVTHVCKHGGQKLFIAGEEEGINLRINTSEEVPEFQLDMEGNTVLFTGVVKEMDEEFIAQSLEEEKEHHGEDAEGHENAEGRNKEVYVVASTFKNN